MRGHFGAHIYIIYCGGVLKANDPGLFRVGSGDRLNFVRIDKQGCNT